MQGVGGERLLASEHGSVMVVKCPHFSHVMWFRKHILGTASAFKFGRFLCLQIPDARCLSPPDFAGGLRFGENVRIATGMLVSF